MSLLRAPAMVFGGLARTALTNERLFLMGVTSLALSLASGWTTYEGMTNFTGAAALCFLITFGIQGIMLVSAWMIGESLVNNQSKDQTPSFTRALLGPLSLFKIWMIWMVFLFSMAISVFFSFDSLFSSIFSLEERSRAAEIRAQNQVAGVITDLKKRMEQRQFEAIDTLFSTDGWTSYKTRLDRLTNIARTAPERVEQQLLKKMRGEQAEIARHQETLAQAKANSAAIRARQNQINQTISRLKQDRPGLSSEVAELRQIVREKQRKIDAIQAEAAKEARGIGTTGREGQGPKFRAIKQTERKLQAEFEVSNQQKQKAITRLEALDQRIAKSQRELALINGEVAKIEGEAAVAKQFIDIEKQRQNSPERSNLSATASIDGLDAARTRFRRQPDRANFISVQKGCSNLHSALTEVPNIANKVKSISCEPGAVALTYATRIFVLQEALVSLSKKCQIKSTRSSKKSSSKNRNAYLTKRIDSLLKRGRDCIQSSGLPETDANEFRNILARIDLNRDDQAKNFVVTLNAFADGNWLAYLALALAISIDSLVFLSGLIGAKTAAFENTGNLSDVMRYGLGMSSEVYGYEPEDILTRKIFFRNISGPSPLKGHLAMLDMQNVSRDDTPYVTKVLTMSGDNIIADEHRPDVYHIEEKFYQNLARQVYLWDQFNRPATKKPKKLRKKLRSKDNSGEREADSIRPNFGQMPKTTIVRKGGRTPDFTESGPLTSVTEQKDDADNANQPQSNIHKLSDHIGKENEDDTANNQDISSKTITGADNDNN